MKERILEPGAMQKINRGIKDHRVKWALGASLALGAIGAAGCSLTSKEDVEIAVSQGVEKALAGLSTATTLGSSSESTTTTDVNRAIESSLAEKDVTFYGIPDSVDLKTVDRANHGPFTNRVGLGSDMIFGEPGVLLVGADFDSKNNPYGDNPNGWQTMYESEGGI